VLLAGKPPCPSMGHPLMSGGRTRDPAEREGLNPLGGIAPPWGGAPECALVAHTYPKVPYRPAGPSELLISRDTPPNGHPLGSASSGSPAPAAPAVPKVPRVAALPLQDRDHVRCGQGRQAQAPT